MRGWLVASGMQDHLPDAAGKAGVSQHMKPQHKLSCWPWGGRVGLWGCCRVCGEQQAWCEPLLSRLPGPGHSLSCTPSPSFFLQSFPAQSGLFPALQEAFLLPPPLDSLYSLNAVSFPCFQFLE